MQILFATTHVKFQDHFKNITFVHLRKLHLPESVGGNKKNCNR